MRDTTSTSSSGSSALTRCSTSRAGWITLRSARISRAGDAERAQRRCRSPPDRPRHDTRPGRGQDAAGRSPSRTPSGAPSTPNTRPGSAGPGPREDQGRADAGPAGLHDPVTGGNSGPSPPVDRVKRSNVTRGNDRRLLRRGFSDHRSGGRARFSERGGRRARRRRAAPAFPADVQVRHRRADDETADPQRGVRLRPPARPDRAHHEPGEAAGGDQGEGAPPRPRQRLGLRRPRARRHHAASAWSARSSTTSSRWPACSPPRTTSNCCAPRTTSPAPRPTATAACT